ncbi:hypothetical protein CBR_g39715 [Chara braunii]|uniref:DUF4360 domain-containing protein n=1 Tax=Chara braunii TaxID=69332 RepID=A0A388LSC6_CHABU|nr:hypothetical protein CBR_g39715 [Chara braunii]|eukprot:GBG85149.1 hypothetical protein CBR_g39715 [Chara braunii]
MLFYVILMRCALGGQEANFTSGYENKGALTGTLRTVRCDLLSDLRGLWGSQAGAARSGVRSVFFHGISAEERELRGRLQANISRSGEVGGWVICCHRRNSSSVAGRGDKSKVRRKAKTKRIRHRLFQSVSTMAAMVVLLLLVLLQLAVPGLAQSPASGTVTIANFKYGGTGCPPGSADGLISEDGQTLTVIYSKYTVFTPGRLEDRRKLCQVAVNLIYPEGLTFTLGTVTFRGYAQFEEDVTGAVAAAYYFAEGTVRAVHNMPPPVEGNFEFTDKFVDLVFAPCGSTTVKLNINSEARVVPPPPPKNNNTGLITVDSTDLSFRQIFSLTWNAC